MTYEELDARLGKRNTRKIANNTYIERRFRAFDNEMIMSIAVRLHQTDVVTFHDDNTATLCTGGWPTMVTKDRINTALAPRCSVYSMRGKWVVQWWATAHHEGLHPGSGFFITPHTPHAHHPFFDRMRIDLNDANVLDKGSGYQVESEKRDPHPLFQSTHPRDRCWMKRDNSDKDCGLFLSWNGACSKHGHLAMPGSDLNLLEV